MVPLPASIGPVGVWFACTLLPILATVIVGLRLWVRTTRRARIAIDDYTIIAGLALMWGMNGIIIAGASEKIFGYHTDQDSKTGRLKVTWREYRQVEACYLMFILMIHMLSLGSIKLSIVLLYRRIFASSPRFNIWSLILSLIIVLWALSFFFATLFQCGLHFSAYWSGPKAYKEFCDSEPAETTAFCITDIVTDLLILATPVPMIWGLHMSFGQKVGLSAVFALGFLSTAAGTVRAVLTGILELGTELGFRDLLADNTTIVVWCLIEASAAIIGACLPTIRPLFASRSTESLVGSLRSWFSLRSRSSLSKDGIYPLGDDEAVDLKELKKGSKMSHSTAKTAAELRESSIRQWRVEV